MINVTNGNVEKDNESQFLIEIFSFHTEKFACSPQDFY